MSKQVARVLSILALIGLCITAVSMLSEQRGTARAALQNDMPVVFVDPLNITADVGETFTIQVKIFNLTAAFYMADESWSIGEGLPPPGGRYNYSLGHLWALDIRLKWDPAILDYISHTAMIPVEDHPGGILHEPLLKAPEYVDETAGTYKLSVSSQAPATTFSAPGANATVLNMTFTVKKTGKCAIDIYNAELPTDIVGLYSDGAKLQQEIPHWVVDGQFQTSKLLTRIDTVEAGALVVGQIYDPAIDGEDVRIEINMTNDGQVTDTFNVSLYKGAELLQQWTDEELEPGASKGFNHTIAAVDAPLGVHTITVTAQILHESETSSDEWIQSFRVIDTPDLEISGPSTVGPLQKVSFSASGSSHNDPNGNITTYAWTLWKPGESLPTVRETGESVNFTMTAKPVTGDWIVMVVATDNFGVTTVPGASDLTPTATLLRPAAAPYRVTKVLTVTESAGGLNIEWILLIIILVVIIAVAVLYLRRRSR